MAGSRGCCRAAVRPWHGRGSGRHNFVITEPILDYLEAFVELGRFVEGATDQELRTLRVVA